MTNLKEPQGQVARWLETLQEFNFTITHRKGKNHNNADALSRRPCNQECRTCKRQSATPQIQIVSSVGDLAQRQAREEPVATLYRAVQAQQPISDDQLQEASPELYRLAQHYDSSYLRPDGVLAVRLTQNDRPRTVTICPPISP
jgi:hypothetical protein